MQIVDVLCDERRTFAGAVETCQSTMSSAGLRLREILLHSKPTPPGFVPHLLARYKSIERYLFVLCPNASERPEIGNSALGGNTCPGKRNDDRGIFDQLSQTLYRSGKIGGDHLCIVAAFYQSVRFSLCDTCTLCCAFVISTLRSTFIATSSA